MKEIQIKTYPFEFMVLKQIRIKKKTNHHSKAFISGYIEENLEDAYVRMALDEIQAKIVIIDEKGQSKTIFYGIVVSLSVDVSGGLKLLNVNLRSSSSLMDIQKHTRIFQDTKLPYTKLIKEIGKEYSGWDVNLLDLQDCPIERIFVQYNETDWNFLRRVASTFHSFLIPADTYEGTKCFIGIPGLNMIQLAANPEYQLKKEIHDYRMKTRNGLPEALEADETYIIFKDRDYYDIGDALIFRGITFYIHEMESSYMGDELLHTYHCKTKKGFETCQIFNKNIIGVSLDAVVDQVDKDQVRITVKDAEGVQSSKKQWFPYSTVYSSPDGTGWYCMPEIGDKVRLYFPSEREEESFVTSSVHLEPADNEARTNPDIKSMKSKYGKEVRFTPDSLILTNNNGLEISLLDKEGIVIESNKSIMIKASEDIEITSMQANLTLMASELVDIEQGKTGLVIDDNIQFKGGKLKME